MSIRLVLELVPDFSGQFLGEERFGALREDGESGEVFWAPQMSSGLDFLFNSWCDSASKLLLLRNHGLHAVVHVLDQLHLGQAKASLV